MSVANGTYFIYARRQGKYLQFTDGLPGTKLTIWQFTGDTDQQWVVAQSPAGNSSTYTVQNNRYESYAATSTVQSDGATYVIGGQQPSHWFLTGALNGYIFSPTPAFDSSWNVKDGYSDDNTPVIFYPLSSDTSNVIWIFNPVTSNSTSTTVSASLTSAAASASTSSSTTSHGLSTSDKISLATSLPSLFVAILGIYLAYRHRSKIGPALRVMLGNPKASFRFHRVDDSATVEMTTVNDEDG